MSRVQTFPATSPIDFVSSQRSRGDTVPWSTSTLVDAISSSPTLRLTASQLGGPTSTSTDEDIFPSLPPLLHGHPDVHLRNGVMNAARLADAHEPDAERAFFVADLSQVYLQHLRWQACLPEIEPFYAIKCNPDPYVLRLLAALGTGFDCASNQEISQVLELGVPPSRIIFANPCKATSFVRNAGARGVDLMTFDNTDELHKVARAHPTAKLVLRILTDDTKSLCQLGIKFGANLDSVPGLLATARELGLDVVGVSFHVGSGCYDPGVYADAIRRARDAFDMGAAAGYAFKLLDVGGGFEDALFEEAAGVLREAIERYFPEREREEVRVIAEPGRFYVSKAFSLAASIIARRAPLAPSPATTADAGGEDDQPSVMYYINDGVYGAFNCLLFDHQTAHPYPLSLSSSFHIPPHLPTHTASIWGPTCDSIDLVSPRTVLPVGLSVGDWLGFDGMGAYTMCAASRFNGFEVSRVVYTTGGGRGAGEVRGLLNGFAKAGCGV